MGKAGSDTGRQAAGQGALDTGEPSFPADELIFGKVVVAAE